MSEVVIAGAYNTVQARSLGERWSTRTIILDAAKGALADAGLSLADVDGVMVAGGPDFGSADFAYETGMDSVWTGSAMIGVPALLEAAAAIEAGYCNTVLIAGGQVAVYEDRGATAPWTRPANEFVASWGLFTAAEFALIARRHMHEYGTTPEQMAHVAATIRNNGHLNPAAVYFGRGPYTADEVLASRMVADPFHLLDCAMTAEGGCAVVLTRASAAGDLRSRPAYVLGGALDAFGPSYRHPPRFDLAGMVGAKAAERAFGRAGVTPEDVDTCEFYDPFSFEIIRQFEAFGFCGPGEGGPYVMSGVIEPEGAHPVCTDGGLLSYSHVGTAQLLQKVVQSVRQVRGDAPNQVPGAKISMATNGGAGALFTHVLLVGSGPA